MTQHVLFGNVCKIPMELLNHKQITFLKEKMTFRSRGGKDLGFGGGTTVELFRIEKDHLVIPRRAGYTYLPDEMLQASKSFISKGTPVDLAFNEELQSTKPDLKQRQDAVLHSFVSAFDTGIPFQGGILAAPCGTGKALVDTEPVVTPEGYVPIASLSVDDLVAGTDGQFHRVTGVYPQGVRKVYKVTFTDRTSVECDSSHLWNVVCRRDGGHTKTLTTEELASCPLRNKAGRKYFLPVIEPVEFQECAVSLDPYTLGALLGDGHLSVPHRVMFTTPDEEILSLMQLPDHHRFHKIAHQNAGKATTYLVAMPGDVAQKHATIASMISELGLSGKRSDEKFVPVCYKYNTVAVRLSVLQGLFDTDGAVSDGNTVDYSTASRQLAEDIQEIVCSLGGTCILVYRETRYTKDGGEKSDAFGSYRLHVKLPASLVPFRLSRRLACLKEIRQREPYRAIDDVSYVGERSATCISVDSPDTLFLTRNYIPTHNTIMALKLLSTLGVTSLVVVHKEFLMDQWRERIEMFLPGVSGDAVGLVQQNKCEYEGKKIVLGMVQSLASKEYPAEFYQWPGVVLFDETHRMGAPVFCKAVPKFPAKYRFGLTATPRRGDGLQPVFEWQIGRVLAKMEGGNEITPKIYQIPYHMTLPPNTYKGVGGKIFLARLINEIVEYPGRNDFICKEIVRATKAGRKVMVLSDRLAQLDEFKDKLQVTAPGVTVGYYVGGMTQEEREMSAKSTVILGTYQMAKEGLDIPEIDTLFLATPKSDVEQSIGRILRGHEDKKEPVVVDVVDSVDKCQDFGRKRLAQYRRLKYDIQKHI